jgi:hypothetical protein
MEQNTTLSLDNSNNNNNQQNDNLEKNIENNISTTESIQVDDTTKNDTMDGFHRPRYILPLIVVSQFAGTSLCDKIAIIRGYEGSVRTV